jgi:hypothetical protein
MEWTCIERKEMCDLKGVTMELIEESDKLAV